MPRCLLGTPSTAFPGRRCQAAFADTGGRICPPVGWEEPPFLGEFAGRIGLRLSYSSVRPLCAQRTCRFLLGSWRPNRATGHVFSSCCWPPSQLAEWDLITQGTAGDGSGRLTHPAIQKVRLQGTTLPLTCTDPQDDQDRRPLDNAL